MFSDVCVTRFLQEQLLPPSAASRARCAFETVRQRASKAPCLVACADPAEYIGEVLAAWTSGRAVFCFNPRWGEIEQNEAQAAVRAHNTKTEKENPSALALYIPTGGTGGRVRFTAHTAQTLIAAARAQIAFLNPSGARFDAVSPLPPWHVSGWMPVVRALVSGGALTLCDGHFASLHSSSVFSPQPSAFRMLSLVPTQLSRLLEREDGPAELRGFDCVLMGGAAMSPELLARAHDERVPLGLGYGMTETAAFVALLLPKDFLAAEFDPAGPLWGRVLPHARIWILDETGVPAPDRCAGRVVIAAESLAPEFAPCLRTQDEGVLRDGRLCILGRLDRFIITGGEKVDPRRVESALQQAPGVRAALVIGEPDAEWGSRLVAFVELRDMTRLPVYDERGLAEFLRAKLAPHCVPKRWHFVQRLPLDEKGKLDHRVLNALKTTHVAA
jgi:O-succinylbenzoic acid--CoA ligase